MTDYPTIESIGLYRMGFPIPANFSREFDLRYIFNREVSIRSYGHRGLCEEEESSSVVELIQEYTWR